MYINYYLYIYAYVSERPSNQVIDQLPTATAQHELQQIAITEKKQRATKYMCSARKAHKFYMTLKSANNNNTVVWLYVYVCMYASTYVYK